MLRAGSRPGQARVMYCVGTVRLCVQTARVLLVSSTCLMERSACVSLGQRHSEWSVIQKWPLAVCQPLLACDGSESAAPGRGLRLQPVKHFLPFVENPTACGAV